MYNMDQNSPDPDDRLRGRPPGRTKKVMNVSMALDVYNALMKIPEGQRSAFIADKLRPIAKQFDPGPSSVVVLSLKYLLDSAIADSKNRHDYEKLAAVSSLTNEIMPVLNPYLNLCRETDSEKVQSFGMVKETDSIKEILDNIRASRILEKLKDILKNAEIIHNAVPQRYRDQQYEKNLEETKTLSHAVISLLEKYGDSNPDVESDKIKQEYKVPLILSNTEGDFRKGLPMYETTRDCKKILEDSKEISDDTTREFVANACSFVDSSVRRSWGSGIELQMKSYSVDPKRGTFLVTLFNRGYYDVSITDVICDDIQVTFHVRYSSKTGNIPVLEEVVVEVRPCTLLSEKPEHQVTLEIGYIKITFRIERLDL